MMTEADKLRDQRRARDAAQAKTQALRHAIGRAREDLDLATRRGDADRVKKIGREIATLRGRQETLVGDLRSVDAAIERLRGVVLDEGPTEIGRLTSKVPIALLPVRLETHFARAGRRVSELRIRVYPDDLHADGHELELTDEEVAVGRAYWKQIWRAAGDTARRETAWRALAEELGTERAAWVAQATAPQNDPPDLPQPIAADATLPRAPDFPDPPRKEEDWTRAPLARAMPDRWVAMGFRDGARIFVESGAQIPEALAIGPDPMAERPADEDLFIDEPSRWTIDFDRAEAVGMGIRVRATRALSLDAGLDLLLVIGVKASAGPVEGAETLTQLFEAHRYTEGLAFLRRGTPTNNSEVERSGWRDELTSGITTVVPGATPFEPGDTSNAGRWAAALGLDAEQARRAFAEAEGATDRDDEDAHAMNAGLWPGTWGYLLEHMAGTDMRPHIVNLRRHVLKWVRAGGHHASLRLGNQPYALVVQTDLDQIKFRKEHETERRLLDLLLKLRDNFWIPAIERVPHIGRTGDPERDLVEILGQRAASSTYAARPAIGVEFFANLMTLFGGAPYTHWLVAHQAAARSALVRLGLDGNARILELAFFSRSSDEIQTLVQTGEIRPGQTLEPNYIKWLLEHGHGRILREEFSADPPVTLLYMLLRQSVLQETSREAIVHLVAAQPALSQVGFEPELVDVRSVPAATQEADLTLARVLDVPIAGVTDGISIGAHLSARRHSNESRLALFREFWDALDHLKGLPVEQLELLLRETLDLSSHRLDAWLSSFAARLLAARRSAEGGQVGVHVGGYGWVEQLRPRVEQRSDGYVHAPSVEHAGLAAVLRSAYLSHRESDGAGAFAVDLSSERVRLAVWLLEGVREGQPLGALLGYRFERALHEDHPGLELDKFIYAMRRRAPLVAGKLEPTTEPLEAVAARNVVDGLALVRRWERGHLSFDDDDLPAQGSPEHSAIVHELDALLALIDAVGDALLAESVFQIGNPSRSGATLDTVASGELPPPELEFAKTPRSGLGVVHRVAVALPAGIPAPGGWAPDERQARAVADPALDAWVGALLGAADRYRYRVRYVDAGDATVVHEDQRSLATLEISPLDAVFLADAEDPDGATELVERARHEAALNRPPGVSASAAVEIQLESPEDDVTTRELVEVARAVRQILHRVRPLDGEQLAALGESSDAGVELAELETRAQGLVTRFTQLETQLTQFLDDEESASLDALRETLLGFHAFGLPWAVPRSASGSGAPEREVLVIQARAVGSKVATRRRALDQETAAFDLASADTAQRVAHARGIAQAVLGGVLPVLPRFVAPNGDELAESLAQQDTLTNGDPQAPVIWLQRNARVRDRVADLHDVLLYDGAINAHDPYTVHIAQLPFRDGSRWAALPGPLDREEDANRLSLVLLAPVGFDPRTALAGFIVDEWSETIPNQTETTALTFHYDQPGARAPNAVLLAVAPDVEGSWDLDTLVKIARDTLELAKIRCVDGDAMEGLGQLLPALLFASNAENDTIEMPLKRILDVRPVTAREV